MISKGQVVDNINKEFKHPYLTTRIHGGLVAPHHSSMLYFVEEFVGGIEVNYGRSLFSKDSWESYFNYPEIGVGLYYGSFGNKDIYGSGIAVFPYINHVMKRTPRFTLQNKVALGLGYATKPYDRKSNPYNSVVSTHFNAYIGLAFVADYRIQERFSLNFTTSLTHFSNGATKKPNHGINTLTSSIGAKYHFNPNPTPQYHKIKAPKSNQQEMMIIGSLGRSQSANYNNNKYWNAGININYLWHLTEKKAIGIGYDQIYSESIPFTWIDFNQDQSQTTFSTSDYLVSSVFASYNVFLGKTIIFLNLGAYIHTGIKPSQPIYPRLGIRQMLTNNLLASFGVKASFFSSEFLEFGLGYRFNTKN